MHLLGNMVGLFFFGREVGRAFGGRALLALYVAGGIGGGAAHCLWRYWQIRGAPQNPRISTLRAGDNRWNDYGERDVHINGRNQTPIYSPASEFISVKRCMVWTECVTCDKFKLL